jgi:hypothetical protein
MFRDLHTVPTCILWPVLEQKRFKFGFQFDLPLQPPLAITSQPADDLVNFAFRTILTFRFLNV